MEAYDTIVIGGGPAGMAAALAAASLRLNAECGMRNAELEDENVSHYAEFHDEIGGGNPIPNSPRVALIERAPVLGGILNQCTHTGFGLAYFGEELTGREYAQRFVTRVESSDVEVFTDTMVLSIDIDRIVTISGANTGFRRLQTRAIILATGCRERPIGALPITGSRPSGIFTAGAAQKMINLGGYDIGSNFIILGSGDVGLIVARELAMRGKNVIAVIEKETICGGLERNRINCLEKYNIPLVTRATVAEIHGMPRITGVTMIDLNSGESQLIDCDALITSVGLIPERELLDTLNEHQEDAECSIPNSPQGVPDWLFLCGNAAFVHDAVDDVTLESERVGRNAVLNAECGMRNTENSECGMRNAELIDKNASRSAELNGESYGDNSIPNSEFRIPNSQGVLCLACPKGCIAVKTEGGWSGLACGRTEP